MGEEEKHKIVLDLISQKSVLKRDVFELIKVQFSELKDTLEALAAELKIEVEKIDPRLEVSYKALGSYYCQLTIAGDVLLFSMHTNVFRFPDNSMYWKSSYLQESSNNGYCGIIQVHNFLADSFRFNRENDLGYMIARILINKENHFFVEGKKELGYKFNDFVNAEMSKPKLREVLCAIIAYTINFDLFIPSYAKVQQITLHEANTLKDKVSLKTGKRLGYQFSSGDDQIEG